MYTKHSLKGQRQNMYIQLDTEGDEETATESNANL